MLLNFAFGFMSNNAKSGNIVFDKNIMKHSLAFAQLYILFILFTSLTFYNVGKDGFKISIA